MDKRYLLSGLGLLLAASLSMPTFAATKQQLSERAMDPQLPKAERIEAIKSLYSDMLQGNAIPKRKICVWDIVGRAGPIFAAAKDQQAQLMEMGIEIQLDAYTSEGVLVEDLHAGQCDAALFTGIRARTFNKFTGTIDAVGAIPSSEHMNVLMKVLTHPKNAPKMTEGKYVVMGMAPMGAAYFYVNDKSINSIAKAAGKRVAVMDYDPVQAEMVLGFGANPVPTSLVNAGSKFNNRLVDVLPAPLVAYQMMELYKGIGEKGGIINYPFTQLTLQLVGRADKFPAEIAQIVREDFYDRFTEMEDMVKRQTGELPANVWVDIPDEDKMGYELVMQEARIRLRDNNYYDAEMLTLERKIRCKFVPSRAECTNPVE